MLGAVAGSSTSRSRLVRLGFLLIATLVAACLPAEAQTPLQGAQGGELKSFTVPAKGKLTEIVVWGDGAINGLAFGYRTERDFPSTETRSPVFGAAKGQQRRIQILRPPVKAATLTWGGALNSIKLEFDGQSIPPETVGGAGPQKADLSFTPNSDITGVRMRADANQVYALAFDTTARVGPPPGVTLTIAKPDSTPTPPDPSAQFTFAGDEFKFGGLWQTAIGGAGTVSLIGDDGQSAKALGAMTDNCIMCANYYTPAIIRIMPLDPAGNQIRIRFDRFPGQEAILTRQSAEGATADGYNKGATWMVNGGGMRAVFYLFDDANTPDSLKNYRLELTTTGSHFVSGTSSNTWTYQRPRTMRLDLEGQKAAAQEDALLDARASAGPPAASLVKDSTENQYATNSQVGGAGYLLSGYDGAIVQIEQPNKGLKAPVFRNPIATKWDIDKYLADPKVVPRGLVAVNRIQHGTHYSQSALSSESDVHKEIGGNFGLSGGPMGASVGLSFSQSVASGLRENHESMMALGVSRSYNYALVLDKAELKLSNEFKASVRQYLIPALRSDPGNKTYDDFVETFGTHYANAATFGGMGVAKKTVTADTYMNWAERSMSVDITGGAGNAKKGPSAGFSGGINSSNGSSSSYAVSFEDGSFAGVGGIGVNEHSFSVPLQASVPVLFDLRPISELVSGLWFDEPDATLLSVRRSLDAAIKRHFEKTPVTLSTESRIPRAYRLEVSSLYCDGPGDFGDDDKSVSMNYSGSLTYTDDRQGGTLKVVQFNEWTKVKCDGKTAVPLNKSAILWSVPTSGKTPTISLDIGGLSASGTGLSGGARLWDGDGDKGKQTASWPASISASPRWTDGTVSFNSGKSTYTFGNTKTHPRFHITYRVQQIQ